MSAYREIAEQSPPLAEAPRPVEAAKPAEPKPPIKWQPNWDWYIIGIMGVITSALLALCVWLANGTERDCLSRGGVYHMQRVQDHYVPRVGMMPTYETQCLGAKQ